MHNLAYVFIGASVASFFWAELFRRHLRDHTRELRWINLILDPRRKYQLLSKDADQ